jgi:acylaminoacyl-peptidase
MRNPVTDLPGMLSTTDIIDWCYVEALGPRDAYPYLFKPDADPSNPFGRERVYTTMPSEKDLAVFRAISPVVHVNNVKAPTLMLIGAKDRRVPQSQGISYYHTLRSLGVKTKMLVFPEDVHAIDRPQSEAEQWVAIAEWLMLHL